MSPHTNTRVFPRSLTWLGILILGSALTSLGVPFASANAPALRTSTIEWSQATLPHGLLTGGTPVDFVSGDRGWTGAPFSLVGPMGLEWTTPFDPARRDAFFGTLQSSSIEAGGLSTWMATGHMFPRPDDAFFIRNTIAMEHNQSAWTIRILPRDPDVVEKYRFYWEANLAADFDPVYSSPSAGVIVITDASHRNPTLVLAASSTSGVVQWGGKGNVNQALSGGELTPTMYLHSTNEMDITISITLGILDADPCSSAEALAFASAGAGVTGTAWPSITHCMADVSWLATAGDEEVLEIALQQGTPALAEGATRSLSIEGLPEGVTWERLEDTAEALRVRLQASSQASPGNYSLQFFAQTLTNTGGVISRSQPLRSQGGLALEPALLPASTEPEPSEDETPPQGSADDPDISDSADHEPAPVEDAAAYPEGEHGLAEEDPAPENHEYENPGHEAFPEPDDEVLVLGEPEQAMENPAPPQAPSSSGGDPSAVVAREPAQDELAPAVVKSASDPPQAQPPEAPREPEPENQPLAPGTSEAPSPIPPGVGDGAQGPQTPPEPALASAWLGLSLAATLAFGGLIAALRKRGEEPEL